LVNVFYCSEPPTFIRLHDIYAVADYDVPFTREITSIGYSVSGTDAVYIARGRVFAQSFATDGALIQFGEVGVIVEKKN
jgi:hypothetical protein